jgi:hypothetical protein
MGYISRYIREHYVRRNIRRDLYDRLIRWCGEKSINLCIEKALNILEANIAPNTGAQSASQSITQSKVKTGERRHVIVFTLEWAREKNINIEEYMARKEKEGYLCNEASRKVYCIWREDIEQLVVDLNNSNARMGELERILSGERLDIARKAVDAGLLWYDSKEKRWRAPL